MARKLKYLVIHCTATPEGMHVYPDDIERWHTTPPPVGRGWKQVGYRDMILLKDGLLVNLVPYNNDDVVDAWEITNGVAGINNVSAHVVYVGGCDSELKPKDTRTPEQTETLRQYVLAFLKNHPDAKVAGHNQFAAKACPSFDVPKWLESIGVPSKNIYVSA